ncbi:MAG: TetR family transcriptional regulator [Acidobacteriota bacterium]|nr:TetR/AcrR family transcriptional regulator [Blastocatellia bacterium]MDW8411911.1 TetR family transcriptional regulator [Acidobacteriota bacterium]
MSTAKKELLLEAAYEEIAARGLAALTLDALAARAGVSKGITVYYFNSKEQLLDELFVWLTDRILSELDELAKQVESASSFITKVVNYFFSSAQKSRALYGTYLYFAASASHNQAFRRTKRRFHDRLGQIARSVIVTAVRSGELPPQDIERTVVLSQLIIEGMLSRWLTEEDFAVLPLYKDCCLQELYSLAGCRIVCRNW